MTEKSKKSEADIKDILSQLEIGPLLQETEESWPYWIGETRPQSGLTGRAKIPEKVPYR